MKSPKVEPEHTSEKPEAEMKPPEDPAAEKHSTGVKSPPVEPEVGLSEFLFFNFHNI